MGRTSDRTSRAARNRQRALPTRERHGRAATPQGADRRDAGGGARLAAGARPVPDAGGSHPLAEGKPTEDYAWTWSVYSWLDGENATADRLPPLAPARPPLPLAA